MEIIKKNIRPASNEEITMLATEYTNDLIEELAIDVLSNSEMNHYNKKITEEEKKIIESWREHYIEELPEVLEQIRPSALKFEFLLANGKQVTFYTFVVYDKIDDDWEDLYGVNIYQYYCVECENGEMVLTTNKSDFGDSVFVPEDKKSFETFNDEKWVKHQGHIGDLNRHFAHLRARHKFRKMEKNKLKIVK
jgi:hypothetical protein